MLLNILHTYVYHMYVVHICVCMYITYCILRHVNIHRKLIEQARNDSF